jgi:hypothetical protein
VQTRVQNPTHAADCSRSSLGFELGRFLQISRTERTDSGTTTEWERFWLDAEGRVTERPGYDVSGLSGLVLLVYFIGMEARYGATVGKWIMRSRVVVRSDPAKQALGIPRALGRRLLMMLVFVAILPVLFAPIGTDLRSISIRVGAALAAAWVVWIVISMVRKRDTIYDRLAGTAVVRQSP